MPPDAHDLPPAEGKTSPQPRALEITWPPSSTGLQLPACLEMEQPTQPRGDSATHTTLPPLAARSSPSPPPPQAAFSAWPPVPLACLVWPGLARPPPTQGPFPQKPPTTRCSRPPPCPARHLGTAPTINLVVAPRLGIPSCPEPSPSPSLARLLLQRRALLSCRGQEHYCACAAPALQYRPPFAAVEPASSAHARKLSGRHGFPEQG